MNDCQAISIVRERFPDIDEEIFQYIEGKFLASFKKFF